MFEKFWFKKSNTGSQDPSQHALLPRGIEVVEENDPETGWGLWDEATAAQELRQRNGMQPKGADQPLPMTPLPDLPPPSFDGFHSDPGASTLPMEYEEKTPAQRADDALAVIELHHARIAKTIRVMWGHKECSSYVSKLLMTGYDDTGNARMGFHHEAVEAMMILTDLHDQIYGFVQTNEFGSYDGPIGNAMSPSRRR